ncbi:hypothetical protein H1V43_32080 [Streptomyces sp. PSKA54]|uniref:Uncharacterized protein n=1 Tax=Streptomyces himalayensis subsp. aureolus TaxID=2758039 RepID=A0A7W2HJB2_9ACTN|nr:hypothetical protein [Streptomyces himalayensis]MBA4865903.1 hypothetical protein [Streptomyces himalayensis subsp. aureolus]
MLQEYPMYKVQGNGPNETAVVVEMRVQVDAGGLGNITSGDDIVQILRTAMLDAGATTVNAAATSLQTAQIPAS